MGLAQKKIKVERDQFTEDGTRLFNPTKPHGTVYADGFSEIKFIQEYEGQEVCYRGDHAPVGYRKGTIRAKTQPELLTENEFLQSRIHDLEEASRRTNDLLERLVKQAGRPGGNEAIAPDEPRFAEGDPRPSTAAPTPDNGSAPNAPTPEQLHQDQERQKKNQARPR